MREIWPQEQLRNGGESFPPAFFCSVCPQALERGTFHTDVMMFFHSILPDFSLSEVQTCNRKGLRVKQRGYLLVLLALFLNKQRKEGTSNLSFSTPV
jgi:hypothetical protein